MNDGVAPAPQVVAPACYADVLNVGGNHVRQVLVPRQTVELTRDACGTWRGDATAAGHEPFRTLKSSDAFDPSERVLTISAEAYDLLQTAPDLTHGKWKGDRTRHEPADVLESLVD